jgi:hypothetical protein
MTEDDLGNLRDALRKKVHCITSAEADFEAQTWTFRAPGARVAAGDYFIVSVSDWMHFWELEQTKLWAAPKPPTCICLQYSDRPGVAWQIDSKCPVHGLK